MGEGFSPSSALVLVILLALAPFVAVMVTSFTKIVVVFSLVRNALGLQQTPPNIVINGIALILSLFVMSPVVQEVSAIAAAKPVLASGGSVQSVLDFANEAKEPFRAFMLRHTTPRERAFFYRTLQRMRPPGAEPALAETDLIVVTPAFVVTELTEAFQIGFIIFLPFLIIDLIISNVLMTLGMMMMSAVTVSLPFKILLFVAVDGWGKLAHSLVLSYL